jgi:hypothetical protein
MSEKLKPSDHFRSIKLFLDIYDVYHSQFVDFSNSANDKRHRSIIVSRVYIILYHAVILTSDHPGLDPTK